MVFITTSSTGLSFLSVGTEAISSTTSMPSVTSSSLSGGEQVKLVFDALWMRGAKVVRCAVPYEGYWRYGDSSVILNLEENVRLLHESLGLPVPKAE